MDIVLLGPPGAGKGTQAGILAQGLGLLHVATGDLFRDEARRGSELGNVIKGYMDRGQLVPDEVTVRVLLERISRPDADAGVIFDGYPRTVAQAEALEGALAQEGREISRVLLINVEDEELVRRLGGRWLCRDCGALYHERANPPATAGACDRCGGPLYQREDDRPETVRTRLEAMKPPPELVEYYRRQGKLVEVDGGQPVEAVARRLREAVAVR